MKHHRGLTQIFFLTLLLITVSISSYYLFENIWSILVPVAVYLIIILQGLIRLPEANPATVGLLTFFGTKQPKIVPEGWNFCFLDGLVYGVYPINREKRSLSFTVENLRSKDLAQLSVPITLSWGPNIEDPHQLIKFVNEGEDKIIVPQLKEKIADALRGWARQRDWEEVISSKEEIIFVLVKKIQDNLSAPEEELNEKTLGFVQKLKEGEIEFPLLGWGIIIKQINIGEIQVEGETAIAAEKRAKEIKEREGEIEEIEFLNKAIASLLKKYPELNAQDVIDAIQAERGKATRTTKRDVYELRFPPDVKEEIKELLDTFNTKKKIRDINLLDLHPEVIALIKDILTKK